MPNVSVAGVPGLPTVQLNKLRRQRLLLRKRLVVLLCCGSDDGESGAMAAALTADLLAYLSTGQVQVFSAALRRRQVSDPLLQTLLQHLFRSIDSTTDTLLSLLTNVAAAAAGAPAVATRLCRTLQLRFVLEEQVVEVLTTACTPAATSERQNTAHSPRRQRWKRVSQG